MEERVTEGLAQVKVEEYCYTWTISNVTEDNFFQTRSTEIKLCINNIRYLFKLSYRRYKDTDLAIVRLSKLDDKPSIQLDIRLLLLSVKENNNLLNELCVFNQKNDLYCRGFISKDYIFNQNNFFLVNGNLHIQCKMYHGCGKVRNFAQISNYNRPCERQHKELGIVLNQKLYSDFKFVVNGKEFYVHKCILSACSPVFTAMLQSNMAESSENKMEITDVDADVMEECLNFIYTGQVKDIQKFGKQLLVVADKYEIKALKTVCENSIINSVSIENFGEMLIFVDTYKANSLLFDMALFFVGNAKEIIATEGFKTALKSCPLWVTELIKTLVYR